MLVATLVRRARGERAPGFPLSGVLAAGLAARGYTGIPSLLARDEYHDWAADIGENYLMVEGVAWKAARYACCGWAHAGVEGARRLVLANAINPDDIAEIVVEGSHSTAALFAACRARGRPPSASTVRIASSKRRR